MKSPYKKLSHSIWLYTHIERKDSHKTLSGTETTHEDILGQAPLVTRILCLNDRTQRGTDQEVYKVVART